MNPKNYCLPASSNSVIVTLTRTFLYSSNGFQIDLEMRILKCGNDFETKAQQNEHQEGKSDPPDKLGVCQEETESYGMFVSTFFGIAKDNRRT